MTADSIPVNPDWPMNKREDGESSEQSAYSFSASNPEISDELRELETARGPRRMELLLKLSERLYAMRLMMEDELMV